MNLKLLVWIGIFIGSTIGGYVPMLWGAELLSVSGVIGSVIGGLLGIYAAYKFNQRF